MAEIQHQRPTDSSPSASQLLAVASLLPISGVLLTLTGLVLSGTVICLAVSAPLFVIFSPILVLAALAIALAATGFLTSGAFGITALASLAWLLDQMRRMSEGFPEQIERLGRRVQDMAIHLGEKTREVSLKAQDVMA